MAELATHLYLSRVGRYIGHGETPEVPVPDTVYAYAVYSNGSISSMGSGTYSAASDYYYPGAAYGYEPPERLRDDPYWETFNPGAVWYGFTGSGLDYWDLRYGVSNSSVIRAKPTAFTERTYRSFNSDGAGLLTVYYDTSAVPGGTIDPAKTYLAISPWCTPGEEPGVVPVLGVVDLDALFALNGIVVDPAFHTADFFTTTPVEKPVFWTSLVGTKETV